MSIFHKNSGKGYNICKKFQTGSVILMTQMTNRKKTELIDFFDLQSVSWILAEFCYNRSPQGPYTGTCTILQETINGFLCPLIVFRKM